MHQLGINLARPLILCSAIARLVGWVEVTKPNTSTVDQKPNAPRAIAFSRLG
ncbi:MAG: hypothetical protein KME12_26815 [Trichocoleus desertorum ATA4-8-CV12]|nr:hypothetical protein [Trichocoleus desertorum ATA4-8-CV12]